MSVVRDLSEKASRAARSARILFEAGDVDGACNRAYYAMFDAARAALSTVGVLPATLKSHSSVIALSGLHFVKSGLVSREIGKAINDVQEIRQIADYLPDEVPLERAEWAVQHAEIFITNILRFPAIQEELDEAARHRW